MAASDHKKSVSKRMILGQGTESRGLILSSFCKYQTMAQWETTLLFSTLEFCSQVAPSWSLTNKNTWRGNILNYWFGLQISCKHSGSHRTCNLVSHNPAGVFEESVLKPWLVMQERLAGEILDERAANLYENTTYRKSAQTHVRAVQLHVIHVYSGSHQMAKSKTTNQVWHTFSTAKRSSNQHTHSWVWRSTFQDWSFLIHNQWFGLICYLH